jgi:hypothetical protein
MRCFFKFNGFKCLVLSGVLCSFSLAVVTPPPIYSQISINLNNVNFGIKLQKLIDKAWKYYKHLDNESLLDVILEIKSEVESYTGKKIDISKEIDKIETDLKKKGGKPPHDLFKKFKDRVKKKKKQRLHRALYMNAYFLEQPEMDFNDYLRLTATAKQNQKNEKNELPLKFVVAVTLVLGGAFVMFATAICPVFSYGGEIMMTTGFGMLLDQGLDIYQKE